MRTKTQSRKTRTVRETKTLYQVSARPRLTSAEAEALEKFRARLKEILFNRELKSLILYGSKARGEEHPGADIDLFIVHDSARPEIKDEIHEAASAIGYEWFERENIEIDIQPLVRTVAEFKESSATGEPLLHNIAREGIVLEGEAIMPEEMDRKYHASAHIDDAKQTLRTARLALASGDVRRPIALAFSIYEDAMRALLIAKGIVPKSHEGTQMLFGFHFIKKGLVPKTFAVHYDRMLKDRNDVTYEKKKQYTAEDAARALERAEELLTIAENLIPKLLQEAPWNSTD